MYLIHQEDVNTHGSIWPAAEKYCAFFPNSKYICVCIYIMIYNQ